MKEQTSEAGVGRDATTPKDASEVLPRQFGKYTLLRRMAAGGMAELFLALHRSVAGFEKLIVIKRILPSMTEDQGFVDMLLHEARIAATLSHPNVVQIFDVGQIEGSYFIAMEHIHGEDIQSIVRAMKKKGLNEFPLEHTLAVAIGMCAGLAYAHEKRDLEGNALGIVHRDISPRNIVVSFTGDVKIVDFGIAKSGHAAPEEEGTLKGKAPYMSPEQAQAYPIDGRSDIFAVGVILFELTTGKRLFKGATEFETLKLITEKEYPLPGVIRPGYPPELERIVMRALAKRREDRYQTARELQSDLEAYARQDRIPVSQVGLTTWMASLFEDKLAQHKEALSDVKHLADVIASQHGPSLYEAGPQSITGTGTGTGSGSSSISAVPQAPQRRSAIGPVVAIVAALGIGGGVFWFTKNQDKKPAGVAAGASADAAKDQPAGAGQPAEAKGSLDITSTPDGAAIWINGDLQKEVTPAKIDKLPLGRAIQVKLTKEGLETHREDVTLTEGTPSRKVTAEMKAGSVTVLLKGEPFAAVWVDGKPWKGDKAKVDNLSAGEDHKIVLTAAGYVSRTYTFNAKSGETKSFLDPLVKDPTGGAGDKGSGDKGAGDGKGAPAGGGGTGKLRVGAKGGFCTVTVNGASVGATPLETSVPSGSARVSCKTESGKTMSQVVQVTAGETARVSFKIEE